MDLIVGVECDGASSSVRNGVRVLRFDALGEALELNPHSLRGFYIYTLFIPSWL